MIKFETSEIFKKYSFLKGLDFFFEIFNTQKKRIETAKT
jgi:hypothetical protein